MLHLGTRVACCERSDGCPPRGNISKEGGRFLLPVTSRSNHAHSLTANRLKGSSLTPMASSSDIDGKPITEAEGETDDGSLPGNSGTHSKTQGRQQRRSQATDPQKKAARAASSSRETVSDQRRDYPRQRRSQAADTQEKAARAASSH